MRTQFSWCLNSSPQWLAGVLDWTGSISISPLLWCDWCVRRLYNTRVVKLTDRRMMCFTCCVIHRRARHVLSMWCLILVRPVFGCCKIKKSYVACRVRELFSQHNELGRSVLQSSSPSYYAPIWCKRYQLYSTWVCIIRSFFWLACHFLLECFCLWKNNFPLCSPANYYSCFYYQRWSLSTR